MKKEELDEFHENILELRKLPVFQLFWKHLEAEAAEQSAMINAMGQRPGDFTHPAMIEALARRDQMLRVLGIPREVNAKRDEIDSNRINRKTREGNHAG